MNKTPGVVKLGGDLGTMSLNGFGQSGKPRDELIIPHADHIGGSAIFIDGAAADDDQGRAPFGAFHKIIGMMRKKHSVP